MSYENNIKIEKNNIYDIERLDNDELWCLSKTQCYFTAEHEIILAIIDLVNSVS